MIEFLTQSLKVLVVLMWACFGATMMVFGAMLLLNADWEIVGEMLAVTAILVGLAGFNLIIVMIFD